VAQPIRIARNIAVYTALLVAASLVFAPVAHMGATYIAVASVAGAVYLALVGRLWMLARHRVPIDGAAMRLFSYSITYVTVLFGSMALDVFVRRLH
jgi:protoheme IX farnesyltransferase